MARTVSNYLKSSHCTVRFEEAGKILIVKNKILQPVLEVILKTTYDLVAVSIKKAPCEFGYSRQGDQKPFYSFSPFFFLEIVSMEGVLGCTEIVLFLCIFFLMVFHIQLNCNSYVPLQGFL